METSATTQAISWFRKEEQAETLDLSPKFQRRPVWTKEQSSFLIDTILSGLPIPEIYVRSSSSSTGDTRYEIVDGQQRLRAVLMFGGNDLELVGELVGAQWTSKTFEDLTDAEKSAFWDYRIVVRDVRGATDLEIRDLFKRLNLHSVVLNDQELRHASFTGRFIKAMEALADDEWWLDSRIVNIREVRRMEDVEFVSELFIGLTAGPQDKKKTLDEFYETFDADMPEEAAWVGRFERTRDFIESLLPKAELQAWKGRSDFYTLFLAVGSLIETRTRVDSARKSALRAELAAFRKKVDQAKRRDNTATFPHYVHEYADAVTRAATDLGRREARLRILEGRISSALEEVAISKTKELARTQPADKKRRGRPPL